MKMLLQSLLILCGVLTSVKGNCGPCGPIPKHYEELGCVGEYIDGPCCPERFECPDLTTMDTKVCHLKGKTYRKGETVLKADSPPCSEDCMCGESLNGSGDMTFICPTQECAEMFHGTESNCVHKYSLDHCCPVKQICGDVTRNLPRCQFRGETYNYGERFIPQSYYEACHHCICDENFDNSTSIEENKNCKKLDCGLELNDLDKLKSGCIPIYFKDRKCCPIGFRCPTLDDEILPIEGFSDISYVNPNNLCKFGALTLQRGQSIVTEVKCLECTCMYPPMLDCIREEDCD